MPLFLLSRGSTTADVAADLASKNVKIDPSDVEALVLYVGGLIKETGLTPTAASALQESPYPYGILVDVRDIRAARSDALNLAQMLSTGHAPLKGVTFDTSTVAAYVGGALSAEPTNNRAAIGLAYVDALLRQEEAGRRLAGLTLAEHPLHAGLDSMERGRFDDFTIFRSIAGRFLTLDGRFKIWAKFVTSLTRISDDALAETFEDGLGGRDALDEGLRTLDADSQNELRDLLDEVDSEFRATTREVPFSVGGGPQWRVAAWWRSRVPLNRGNELERRIANTGRDLATGAQADAS